MQMTGGASTTPGNKSPPPPMVQQAVGGGESAGHSRNVSQGSSKSQQPVSRPEATVNVVVEGVEVVPSEQPPAQAINEEQVATTMTVNKTSAETVAAVEEMEKSQAEGAATTIPGEEKPVADKSP